MCRELRAVLRGSSLTLLGGLGGICALPLTHTLLSLLMAAFGAISFEEEVVDIFQVEN